MPAFIIFENTDSHVGTRTKTTRCHDLHPRINHHHQLMVDCQWCLVRPRPWLRDNIPKLLKMKLSSKFQWGSFLDHQMAGISLKTKKNNTPPCRYRTRTIKEELEFASPMNSNSSTKNQQKSRKVDGRRACNCPYPHLQDRMVRRKAKCKKRSCSMDLKPWSSRQ